MYGSVLEIFKKKRFQNILNSFFKIDFLTFHFNFLAFFS